jgi:DNA polymerase-3 subunit beta
MLYFTCEKDKLISAITVTSRTVSQKSTIAALEGILVTAGTLLSLTGYNLETGITVSMEADVREMGAAVFPAKLFGDIVRKMPNDTVTIQVEDNYKVRILSGPSSFSIMATPADDYPSLPDVEYDKAINVPQNVLKDMIGGTIFSVSENQARPIQTGCKFEIDPDHITIIAVDGFRLALRREKIDNPENRTLSFVAPSPALREVEKILGDTDDDASFTLGTKHILFQVGSATLVCRLLEGEFLDWRRVVPTDNPIRVTVNVRDLTQSLERVSLIVSEKLKSPVRCIFTENLAALRTSNSIGNAYDECRLIGNGQDMEIGFNCKYLLEALKAVPAENVSLELKTSLSPAVISPCEGDRFTYMVLPVRLKSGE